MAKWASPSAAGTTTTTGHMDSAALDPEQRAAVTAPLDRPALVVAGPGAGKTRTLTYRAAWLIEQGVPPDRIALVTFTKKAAGEMVNRLSTLTPRAPLVTISTIHSLGYRLLRDWWRSRGIAPYQILTSPTQHISGLLESPSPMYPGAMDYSGRESVDVGRVASAIALYKDRLGDSAVWLGTLGQEFWTALGIGPRDFTELVTLYQRELETRHQVDFEDLYVSLWHAWQASPALADAHRAHFSHVLVDEFQDTSYGQFAVLRQLAPTCIFACGDCDQSVYGWRGAVPKYMLDFRVYYPTAVLFPISTNYRSAPTIVDLSRDLIQNGRDRIDLALHAHRTDGGNVRWECASTMEDEAHTALRWILDLHASGLAYSDFAVLYRTGWYNACLELALLRQHIPYRVVGGTGFFGRRPVLDMISYLSIAADPTGQDARDAFLRIYNTPNRYLGRAYREKLEYAYHQNGSAATSVLALAAQAVVKPHERRGVNHLDHLFLSLGTPCPNSPAGRIIQAIRRATGYDRWFLSHYGTDADDVTVEWLDMMEDISTEMTVAEILGHARDMAASGASEDANAVTLSTIHKAKGLEWRAVAVVGMVKGIMPHRQGDIEEERRIAYVAMTRARDHLLVTSPEWVRGKPRDVSPFIYESGLGSEL